MEGVRVGYSGTCLRLDRKKAAAMLHASPMGGDCTCIILKRWCREFGDLLPFRPCETKDQRFGNHVHLPLKSGLDEKNSRSVKGKRNLRIYPVSPFLRPKIYLFATHTLRTLPPEREEFLSFPSRPGLCFETSSPACFTIILLVVGSYCTHLNTLQTPPLPNVDFGCRPQLTFPVIRMKIDIHGGGPDGRGVVGLCSILVSLNFSLLAGVQAYLIHRPFRPKPVAIGISFDFVVSSRERGGGERCFVCITI